MKRTLFAVILLMVAHLSVAQPEPQGPDHDIANFLRQNLPYPASARQFGAEGVVDLEFEADSTGKIVSTKILNDVQGGCGKSVKRVLLKVPATEIADLVKHSGKTSFLISVIYYLAGPDPATDNPQRNKPLPQTSAYKLPEVVVVARGM